jgi:hypothetical protein
VKRLLQGLALLQLLLVIGIGARIVQVWSTPLPEFGDIPELPAREPIPPPKPAARISDAMTDAVVEHDLFDDQRGQNKVEEVAGGGPEIDAAPVPPPSNVQLMGVMQLGREPVAILLDTSVNPEQKAVRKGDMFGEYQIGEITTGGYMPGLTLLGNAGQQFQIPLKVGAAAAGAIPSPPHNAAAPSAPTRPQAGKPVTAKPVPPQRGDTPPDAGEQKAMSARERAQAIAQRNAELRKNNQKGGQADGERGEKAGGKPDPVQARLEALRQLREAAKSR